MKRAARGPLRAAIPFRKEHPMQVETVKVKPWGEEQGDHVLINKDDFDPERHQLLEELKVKKPAKADAEKKD